jgi:hypothetical protein
LIFLAKDLPQKEQRERRAEREGSGWRSTFFFIPFAFLLSVHSMSSMFSVVNPTRDAFKSDSPPAGTRFALPLAPTKGKEAANESIVACTGGDDELAGFEAH